MIDAARQPSAVNASRRAPVRPTWIGRSVLAIGIQAVAALVICVVLAGCGGGDGTGPREHSAVVFGAGGGRGTVTSDPAGLNCGISGGVTGSQGCVISTTAGAQLRLHANPDSGSTFGGWSGACSGIEACVLGMDAERCSSGVQVVLKQSEIGWPYPSQENGQCGVV